MLHISSNLPFHPLTESAYEVGKHVASGTAKRPFSACQSAELSVGARALLRIAFSGLLITEPAFTVGAHTLDQYNQVTTLFRQGVFDTWWHFGKGLARNDTFFLQ